MRSPGEIIKTQFLDPLDISVPLFAVALGLPLHTVQGVIGGECPIDSNIAERLGEFFETPDSGAWLEIQANYDAKRAKGWLQ